MQTEQTTENQGIIIPGEQIDLENRARDQGWVSKEEFDADERNHGKKWRPAEEFIERGELFDTIKSLKGEIHSIKRDFNLLAQHHKDVAKIEYDRALRDLKTQRAVAAEEGDTKAVVEISDKIDELKEGYAETKQEHKTSNGQHPAYTEWLKDNSWYTSDVALRGAADGMAQEYIKLNPNSSFEDVLAHVSSEMTKKFLKRETPSRPKSATVDSGTNGNHAKKAKLSKADLSDDEKEIMRAFIKRGVFATEQEYMDELAKVKGL